MSPNSKRGNDLPNLITLGPKNEAYIHTYMQTSRTLPNSVLAVIYYIITNQSSFSRLMMVAGKTSLFSAVRHVRMAPDR